MNEVINNVNGSYNGEWREFDHETESVAPDPYGENVSDHESVLTYDSQEDDE